MVNASRTSTTLHGIGVSPGVVSGPVFLLASQAMRVVERRLETGEVDHEIARLEEALIETRRQLRKIQHDLEERTRVSDASIFDAHLMVLDDRVFVEEVLEEIRSKLRNAEAAVKAVTDRYSGVLASVQDDYLRERVADLKDVARRVIRNLSGDVDSTLTTLRAKHVVIAVDLAPSDTAVLRKEIVSGFATDLGSPTSHTAVMARALEIPAVVGLHDVSSRVSTGDDVLIDGSKGVLIINPTPEQLEQYGRMAEARLTIRRGLQSQAHKPAETTDGHRIVLSANVEGPEELPAVIQYGAEGVGLFRSEYLYLSRDEFVGEEEQTRVYAEVAKRLAPAPVIIRTLDLGGDKFFGDSKLPGEMNPFLGCRSIRLSLLYPEHFKVQLRAILRASASGGIKIMYPMISGVAEILRANEILEEAKAELDKAGVPYMKDIEVGAMIEVPSAALSADALAPHVKFFSIGTNDLVQYTLAVDRVNERVAYLYEPTHPAVLKLIHMTVEAAHAHGIWVGVCGEMAADPLMTPLLLGMGLDELSMAPSALPLVKDAVRHMSMPRARELAERALRSPSGAEVLRYCRDLTAELAPELMELV